MKKQHSSMRKAYLLFKIILSSFLLIFAFFSYFSASLGWFSSNKTVRSNGMAVTVSEGDLTFKGIECFPVTKIEEVTEGGINVTKYTFTEFSENSELHEIPVYDTASLIDGTYKKAVVVRIDCHISDGNQVQITARNNTAWAGNTPIGGSELFTVDDDLIYKNVLSNCIQLRNVTHTPPVSEGEAKIAVAPSNDTPNTFATSSDGVNFTKTQAVDVGVFTGSGDTSIYLVMEYNQALVDYYCSGLNYSKVEYENDITFVINDASDTQE